MEKRLRNPPFLARAREADLQRFQMISEKNHGMRRRGDLVLIDEPAGGQNFVVRRRPVDDYTNRPGILPGFNPASQTVSLSTSSSEKSVLCPHSGGWPDLVGGSLRIQYRSPYLYWGVVGRKFVAVPEKPSAIKVLGLR